MSIIDTLTRLITPRQKINPAGEGNPHPGPFHIIGANGGWLPSEWGKWLNFWQMDLDPLPYPGCSIVEACIWAYISAIAQLPGYHKRELDNGGIETVTTSALARVLRNPNDYETPSDFLVHLIRSLLLTGNSYWIAERNDRNEVEALHWTDPRQCHVREISVEGQRAREVFYEISDNPLFDPQRFALSSLVIPARDVLHIKLATPRHPLVGETWLMALTSDLAQRAAINGAQTNAAIYQRPAGILVTDADPKWQPQQIQEIRERWKAQSADMNKGNVPILTHGLKFQPITMSAQDSQVVEQLKMTDQNIAAVFGVPAILLGINTTATQKSSESVMQEWLSARLGWLLNHIEVAFDHFIGLNREPAGMWREWTEFDTRALLRSLYKERIEGLVRGVQGGIYSPNEARELEGYKRVEAGDEPRVQQQVVPLSFALEPPAPPAAPVNPPPGQDAAGGEAEENDEEGASEDEARLYESIAFGELMKHAESFRAIA